MNVQAELYLRMMKKIFVLSLLFFVPVSLIASDGEGTKRPNIILVMADDLGWSDIGCYGGELKTPHIDSLARDGLRFAQFYNNAICGPTRASLLTGLYCQQVGHRGDRWNEPKDFNKCVLISELLQQAGYHTMMVGKWQGRDLALDRGFDRFFGPMCQAKMSYFHEVQQNPYYLNRERFELPEDFYLSEALNNYALDFLKESLSGEKPFFLYVAHVAPHWPLHARESDIAPFRKQYLETGWDQIRKSRFKRQRLAALVPGNWKLSARSKGVRDWETEKHKKWQAERMAVYAAQVAVIDRGLGQLLKAVREAGEEENTLVLFLSDNGAAPDGGLIPTSEGFGFSMKNRRANWRIDGVPIRPGSGPNNMPGPHNTFAGYGLAWANASNTPFNGTKLSGYEGGIRTPLVVRWPAVIHQRGQITKQVGHVIDFMATFLEIAGIKYPNEFKQRRPLPLEGKSLLPIFQGKQREAHSELCWDTPWHHAVLMGQYKAIREKKKGTWQLFDLEADGTETNDLAEKQPQRVQEMAKHFEAWRKRVNIK